jgi:hypothetical protein
MLAETTSRVIVLVGLLAAGGMGWLQWRVLKRLARRPSDWAAASVIGAAVSTPLTTGLLLHTLVQLGLPPGAALPVGLGLILGLLLMGAAWVGVVAWLTARRK